MSGHNFSTKLKIPSERAQAIVEFAIALPVLLLILVGIFEAGRLVFIYAAVNNASREAVRYASAVGLNDSGNYKYRDCAAIISTAQRSAFFTPITMGNVQIQYFRPNKNADGTDVVDGVTGALSETTVDFPTGTDGVCDYNGVDADVSVKSGDRVKVTVTTQYRPMLRLIPLRARTITSTSTRTILGLIELETR